MEKIKFSKEHFVKKSLLPKNPEKRPFRLIKRFFTNRKLQKIKQVRFDRIQTFSEQCRVVPKRTRRVDNLVSPLLLEAKKFLV